MAVKIRKPNFINLETRINKLHESKIITSHLANSLHENRLLGNITLHELKKPEKFELKIAIEIIEHVIDEIYEIKPMTNQLQQMNMKKLGIDVNELDFENL